MSEMIERVTRAISVKVPNCAGATCVFTPISECTCGLIARAAIAAMREPTAEMLEAEIEVGEPLGKTFLDDYSPTRIYQVMIDAVLT
jgi:hypothetical protein